jgi:hypothetical protein
MLKGQSCEYWTQQAARVLEQASFHYSVSNPPWVEFYQVLSTRELVTVGIRPSTLGQFSLQLLILIHFDGCSLCRFFTILQSILELKMLCYCHVTAP